MIAMNAPSVLDTARAAYAAGLCVVPPREDGSKQPDGTWKQYQADRPDSEQMKAWYVRGNCAGVGVVCGAVSGNVECFEFDDRETYRAFIYAARHHELAELVNRIACGYEETTPGDGIHWLYRCDEIGGNAKLACRPGPPDDDGRPTVETLIETRGEGGYVIIAPTNGRVHPTGGAYHLRRGDAATIATITPDERRELHRLAQTFGCLPVSEYRPPADRTPYDPDMMRPGEGFNRRADWRRDVLEPAGWTFVYQRGDVSYWRRPCKDRGVSATVNYADSDLFVCFSTSTPFEPEKGYSKWRVYAIVQHGGDFQAAARDLAAQGYGSALHDGSRLILDIAANDTTQPTAPATPDWPYPPADVVYQGIAGEIVQAIAPETEADPVALLLHLLAAIGNVAGSGPHWRVGGRPHALRVYPVFVGRTSKGRKGTAWSAIKPVLQIAAPDWLDRCTASGLSSGEGLVWAVRDAIVKTEAVKEKGRIVGYQDVMEDPGVEDKRLLVIEEEFAAVLAVMTRESNILSATIRQAWDDGTLRTLTKNKPVRATGAHITILAHVTKDELLRRLHDTEAGNGFANRFVWVCVQRARVLPDGGTYDHDTIGRLGHELAGVLETAQHIGLIERDDAASRRWHEVYEPLSEGGIGLLGAVTSRAEAQVMRLAAIYSLLDESNLIRLEHLDAALAVWDYTDRSARYIFGDALGDPVADAILTALRQSGELSRTDIRDLFGRNQSATRIDRALGVLLSAGRVRRERRDTGGRPLEVWHA